jgi:hypothetical protein
LRFFVDSYSPMFLYFAAMKSPLTQSIHILAALFILAAAVTPVCGGGEQCSMPCCRHKAQPAAHHPADAPSKTCCTHPADASSGIGSGCRFDQHDLALNPQERSTSVPPALLSEDATWTAANDTAWPSFKAEDFLEPLKAPLYLRLQIFLI